MAIVSGQKHIITFLFLIIFPFISGCGIYNDDSLKRYNEFGLKCAKMGLWNEAVMRWKRIIEMDPGNHKAHNNLAIAYESKGELKAAMEEYKKAMELDQDNKIYKRNYMKFKKNYERDMKVQETGSKIQDSRDKMQDEESKNQGSETEN